MPATLAGLWAWAGGLAQASGWLSLWLGSWLGWRRLGLGSARSWHILRYFTMSLIVFLKHVAMFYNILIYSTVELV